MPFETTVRATITSTIKDLLATNADDPTGFIDINYPRRIDHALRMLSTRIPLIGRITVNAATAPYGITSPILPYTFNMTNTDFEDLIGLQVLEDPAITTAYPHNKFLPAVLEHNGANPQVRLYETQVAEFGIGATAYIWHTRSWSLENLPPSYYAIVAEGAAGYAMRAQALAFVRQATLRPDTARLLFAQADAAIASFHAQIENARANRHRMQIHNDNVLGLRLTDTKFDLDQRRIANVQAGIGLAAHLLDRQYIDQKQAERIVRTFDDDLLHTIGRTV